MMPILSNEEWMSFCAIMNGYIYSQTLATACDFDLFSYLSKHPGATQDELREVLGLSPYSIRVLLLACCAVDLIYRAEETGGYFNSPIAEKVLVSHSPYSMIPFVHFNNRIQQRCGLHLTQALRENRNAGLDEFPGDGATLYERLINYPELESLFQEGMGAYTRLSPKMADLPEFADVQHLLDVGGGDATNAVRLCQRHPGLRVSILDIPSVTPIARAAIERHGLEDRIDCWEGDMFTDRWPSGCDGILLSHIAEIFAPEKIRFLYRKALERLVTGGRLFVWTIMANDLETQGVQAAKSSTYFLTTASGEGMAYPAKDHATWLREVGFRAVKRYDSPEIDHGALVAFS
jgi:O-methyltransferase domain/Dimerisation domain